MTHRSGAPLHQGLRGTVGHHEAEATPVQLARGRRSHSQEIPCVSGGKHKQQKTLFRIFDWWNLRTCSDAKGGWHGWLKELFPFQSEVAWRSGEQSEGSGIPPPTIWKCFFLIVKSCDVS